MHTPCDGIQMTKMFGLKFIFLIILFIVNCQCDENVNNRPIIGVLSQELTDKMTQNYGPHKSFVASSYIQFVHGAGARAVPIMIGETQEYYRELLQNLNGVLLPGGSVWFDDKIGGYVEAGRWILQEAENYNSKGDFFPVWGTCLGFELMAFLQNGEHELRVNCSAYNEASPLNFTQDAVQSRLFADAPKELMQIARQENVTSNFHRFCITPMDFKKSKLNESWTILSTNYDDNGIEYISILENKDRPYFATQWHPEKPLYEWGHFNIPHDKNTVTISQYMANFFINQARKNNHTFPSEDVERQYLIYKYPAVFGQATSTYSQLYFFD